MNYKYKRNSALDPPDEVPLFAIKFSSKPAIQPVLSYDQKSYKVSMNIGIKFGTFFYEALS